MEWSFPVSVDAEQGDSTEINQALGYQHWVQQAEQPLSVPVAGTSSVSWKRLCNHCGINKKLSVFCSVNIQFNQIESKALNIYYLLVPGPQFLVHALHCRCNYRGSQDPYQPAWGRRYDPTLWFPVVLHQGEAPPENQPSSFSRKTGHQWGTCPRRHTVGAASPPAGVQAPLSTSSPLEAWLYHLEFNI